MGFHGDREIDPGGTSPVVQSTVQRHLCTVLLSLQLGLLVMGGASCGSDEDSNRNLPTATGGTTGGYTGGPVAGAGGAPAGAGGASGSGGAAAVGGAPGNAGSGNGGQAGGSSASVQFVLKEVH